MGKSNITTLLCLLLLLTSQFLDAQPSERWRKYHTFSPYFYSECTDVVVTDTGYIASGILLDTVDNMYVNKLLIVSLDLQGNIKWQKSYGGPFLQFHYKILFNNNLIQLANDGIYYCGTIKENGDWKAGLFRFDSEGDSLWLQTYQAAADTFYYAFTFSMLPDSGFILGCNKIFNVTNQTAESAGGEMIRLDKNGNKLWSSTVLIFGDLNDLRAIEYEQSSSKYFLTGIRYNSSSGGTQGFIARTDSAGNVESQKIMTSPVGSGFSDIIKTHDGNFVICGMIFETTNGAWEFGRREVIKFDKDLNVIWTRKYGEVLLPNEYGDISELPNGDLICSGEIDKSWGSHANFDMVVDRLDSSGNMIWSRQYDIYGVDILDYMTSIAVARDGGFITCGFFDQFIGSHPFFLMKLDSMGCDTVDCLNAVVGVEKPMVEGPKISLYPNPSNGRFSLELSTPQPYSVTVFDMNWRAIYAATEVKGRHTAELGKQPSGVYMVRVEQDGKQYFRKLRIE